MSKYGDIKLDKDSHDLQLIGGRDLIITNGISESVVQRLGIKLQFFKGEWFLNKLFGIPYNQVVFQKGVNQTRVDKVFREQILNTEGVVEITSFESSFDSVRRIYSVIFSCRDSTGATVILEV